MVCTYFIVENKTQEIIHYTILYCHKWFYFLVLPMTSTSSPKYIVVVLRNVIGW